MCYTYRIGNVSRTEYCMFCECLCVSVRCAQVSSWCLKEIGRRRDEEWPKESNVIALIPSISFHLHHVHRFIKYCSSSRKEWKGEERARRKMNEQNREGIGVRIELHAQSIGSSTINSSNIFAYSLSIESLNIGQTTKAIQIHNDEKYLAVEKKIVPNIVCCPSPVCRAAYRNDLHEAKIGFCLFYNTLRCVLRFVAE